MRWASLTVCVVLAVLSACSTEVSTDSDTDPAADALAEQAAVAPLDSQQYAFCHGESFSSSKLRKWCPVLEHAPPDACPTMRRACAELESAVDDTDAAPETGCSGDSEASGSPSAAPGPDGPKAPPAPDLGEGFAGLASQGLVEIVRWTLALLLAAAVVAVIILVARVVLGWASRRRTTEPDAAPPPADVRLVELVKEAEVPDIPSETLLDSARRALSEGREHDAVLLARGASLRGLAERGEVRLHRSRTDREYVRSLRKQSDKQAVLRVVVRAVERLRWGGSVLDHDTAAKAVEAAGRLVIWLLAVLLLMQASPALAQADYGVDGGAALKQVFDEHGFSVHWRLRSVRDVGDEVDVLVLDAVEIGMGEEDWEAVWAWVRRGGVLFVAGDPGLEVLGAPQRTGGELWMARSARRNGLSMPVFRRKPYCFAGAGGHVWISGGDQDCAVVQAISMGEGGVLALADHSVLRNASFVVPANVDFVGGALLVGEEQGLWIFEEASPRLELATIAGESTSSPLGSLLNARLLPLVAQMLFILMLVALWRGWPFARLRDPPREGRIAFADHVRALGERHMRVGGSRHAARSLAELALLRRGAVTLTAAAVRAGRTQAQANEFVARLQALVDERDGPDSPRDIELMEELWRITQST